jgi:DnaD/phage-associated family protein
MNNGWIKIHRKILYWEWWDKPTTFRLFLYLLLTVNHKDARWMGHEIKRGQTITSIDKLCKELKESKQSIRTSLKHLISTQEITQESPNKQFSLITIKRFEDYQDNTGDNTGLTQEQHRTNTGLTTNNKNKNNKNDKNEEEAVVPNSATFYEKNFGLLTPYSCDLLQEMEEQHGEDNLVKAMKIAIEAGVRSIRYIKAILESESSAGYKFEKVPKSTDEPLLKKLPPAIRKQVERMIEQFIQNTGEQPKDENIKIMINKITHEKNK